MPSHRRPKDYQGGRNWQWRILQDTAAGGALGVLGGAAAAVLSGVSAASYTITIGANGAIIAAALGGGRELVRELRSAPPEDLVNSWLGGLGAGALLAHLQGGHAKALPVVLVLSAAGTLLHAGGTELRRSARWPAAGDQAAATAAATALDRPANTQGAPIAARADAMSAAKGVPSPANSPSTRAELDTWRGAGDGMAEAPAADCHLLPRDGIRPSGGHEPASSGGVDKWRRGDRGGSSWQFPEWFPIQRLDDETAARKQREREESFRRRVEIVRGGGGGAAKGGQ